MSWEAAENSAPESACGNLRDDAPKKPKITYTREFLVSFSELDVCNKLPAGFDASILSELQDASAGVLERHRGHYGAPLGRTDGSSSGYSRGGTGRWDTRSSGSSDRDGDLPEHESFVPDRRPGNQYRPRHWQHTEHDGLLGSGAFPRPSGYVGPLASRARGSGYQLNRSSEPYQPPRPYKAAPLSRKDNIDSCNDETFGSFECSSEDRVEEERKRRVSFELMRQEQQKALQEKKHNPDIQKEKLGDDIMTLLQNSADKKGAMNKNERPDESATGVSEEDTSRPLSGLPAPIPRPLVPPGFSSVLVEKKLQQQSSNTSIESEARNATSKENFPIGACNSGLVEANKSAANIRTRKSEDKSTSDNMACEVQKHVVATSLSAGEAIISTANASGIPKVNEDWEDDAANNYSIEKGGNSKIVNSVRQDNSISILEKFFGNALSKSNSSSPTYVENQQPKSDEDTTVSALSESSKFARWFLEEGKVDLIDSRPAEDLSSKDLFSLIVKNENLGPENPVPGPSVFDATLENLSPRSPVKDSDAASKLLPFSSPTSAVGISEQYHHGDMTEPVPIMMTCEDLEQSMLAEVGKSTSSRQDPVQEHCTFLDEPSAEQKVGIDDHASQHLLSLLQKGTNSKASSPNLHIRSADGPVSFDLDGIVNSGFTGTATVNNAEAVPTSGKDLTLEALFGAAFMNELHSMEAPVSIRGSAAVGPNYGPDIPSSQRVPFAESGNGLFSSNPGEYRCDKQMLHLNHIQDGAASNEPGTRIEHRDSAFQGSSLGSAGFDERGLEIRLPEEDNLFTVNESLDARNPDLLPFVKSGRAESLLQEKAVEELNYKFQNLISGDAEQIQALGPDALSSRSHGLHDQVDSENIYHLFQGRLPSQLPHPMNNARPGFPPMDHIADRNRQAPFNIPEAIHYDPHRPFPPNMNPMQHALSASAGPHLDPAAHQLMLQHMPMPGNFPPQFPPPGLPRGVPPSQSVHPMPGYRPEMGNVNSFQMHPRQPTYEFGMAMPGQPAPDVGGNHPEAFERLVQMELRARSKQLYHPAVAGAGIYGPELDLNIRYR